jgi:ABC-type transport system involved in multi-copper enzyme maturation permease subunit
MDIPSYTLIIIAICCSIIAVYVFREHHDDGTELITVSKPIER